MRVRIDGRSERLPPSGGSNTIGTGCCSWDFGSLVRAWPWFESRVHVYTYRRRTNMVPSKPHAHHRREGVAEPSTGAERANGKADSAKYKEPPSSFAGRFA